MKKLCSLFVALCAALAVMAQDGLQTVFTVEKLWTVPGTSWTSGESRQGTGYDGKIYWADKAQHKIFVAENGEAKEYAATADNIVNGTAIAVDDAGNIITAGAFPAAVTHVTLFKKGETAPVDIPVTLEGGTRCDFINATGDVFSAEGGLVFAWGNAGPLHIITIKNGGAAPETDVIVKKSDAVNGNNGYIVAGNAETQIGISKRSEGTGWSSINGNSFTPVAGMEGWKNSTLGGAICKLGEKEFYIYPAGKTNYSSEFVVRNMTDGAFVVAKEDASQTVLFVNGTEKNGGAGSTANWISTSPIDDKSAYIHVFNAGDGAGVFKLVMEQGYPISVSVAPEEGGTVEGAGLVAVGGQATVKATPNLGYSFVNWTVDGTEVSTEATYSFAVDKALTLVANFKKENDVKLTLAWETAQGGVTGEPAVQAGENTFAYGTPITLTAAPAAEHSFSGWYAGEELKETRLSYTFSITEDIALTAKFVKALIVSYELNGGVVNEQGWTSKGDLLLDIQTDLEAAYPGTFLQKPLNFVKEENGVFYFHIGEEWKTEAEAQGEDCTVANFFQAVTYSGDAKCKNFFEAEGSKYAWIKEIILANPTHNAAGWAADNRDGLWRKDLSGLMLCSPANSSWPASAEWSEYGKVAAITRAWKKGFANPTEIVTEIALNAPYKEDYTFDGWYDNAEFTGEPIDTLSPESVVAGGKLYAKWVEYVPTIAEFCALADDAESKVAGTVSLTLGSNFWIQDATGGLLCYQKDNDYKEGEYLVLNGKKTTYNGSPEMLPAGEPIKRQQGTAVAAENALIEKIIADYTPYLNKLVRIEGATLSSYKTENGNENPYISDGANELVLYKVELDKTAYPEGSKVNVEAVVSIYAKDGAETKIQLRTVPEKVTTPSAIGKDPYAYEKRTSESSPNEYDFTNDWLYSVNLGNWSDNRPNPTEGGSRSVLYKDDILYFAYRENEPAMGTPRLVRVDAKTGEKLEPIYFDVTETKIFINPENGNYYAYPFSDMKLDNEGNAITSNLPTSPSSPFQIWTVDLETGKGELLIDMTAEGKLFKDFFPAHEALRIDRIGVFGDIKANAIIMAASAGTANIYYWRIADGKWNGNVGTVGLTIPEVNFSYAPQICPVSMTDFYVDGFTTYPYLFKITGKLLDSFVTIKEGETVVSDLMYPEGSDKARKTSNNGVTEFELGGEYFMLMAGGASDDNVPSTMVLFKCKDVNRAFAEMEYLWEFPKAGMGAMSNQQRVATTFADVNEEAGEAHIYAFIAENGYGAYTLKVTKGSGVENVTIDGNQPVKVIENGQLYIIKDGVKYTVLGNVVK